MRNFWTELRRYRSKVAIFEALKRRPMNEIEIIEKTQLSKPTVIASLNDLESEGVLFTKREYNDYNQRSYRVARLLLSYLLEFDYPSGVPLNKWELKRLLKRTGIGSIP